MTLSLLDWRRQVAALYAAVRGADDPRAGLATLRAGRDRLFREHRESPIPADERQAFTSCPWWDYDPDFRFVAEVVDRPEDRLVIHSGTGEPFTLVRIGAVELPIGTLDVHWIDVYGGGVFLPFADATSGHETYGAGRYLLDTVKGADLGGHDRWLVLDFNFAYHPSCTYDPRWSCPLAPPGNRLTVPVTVGERLP